MADLPTAPEVARALADALDAAGIPYAVGGAIAYGLHAPPRATNDVDLNVFVELDRLDPALDALEAGGAVIDRSEASRSAEDRGDFSVRVRGMRVDVFVPSLHFYESVRRRVRDATLLGRPIRILSAEDLVVFKMLFFRAKDVGDVERLTMFQGEALDRRYVRQWLVDLVGETDVRIRRWDEIVARS